MYWVDMVVFSLSVCEDVIQSSESETTSLPQGPGNEHTLIRTTVNVTSVTTLVARALLPALHRC